MVLPTAALKARSCPQCAHSQQSELLARYSRVPSLVTLDRGVDISRDLSMGACAISPAQLAGTPARHSPHWQLNRHYRRYAAEAERAINISSGGTRASDERPKLRSRAINQPFRSRPASVVLLRTQIRHPEMQSAIPKAVMRSALAGMA
jgi:hypothetical protein